MFANSDVDVLSDVACDRTCSLRVLADERGHAGLSCRDVVHEAHDFSEQALAMLLVSLDRGDVSHCARTSGIDRIRTAPVRGSPPCFDERMFPSHTTRFDPLRATEIGRAGGDRLLITRDAAVYCGYKSPSGLRKAHFDGKIAPVGRRGGSGPLVWRVADLDKFLLGRGSASFRASKPLRRRPR